MNSIFVCFNLKSSPVFIEKTDEFDKIYQKVYKPLFKFLFSHPDFPLAISFNGPQIEYFKQRKNEAVAILRQLVDRKQVEIIGGGYYDPVLPLLYSVDRNGQIDMLSAEIRQTFGKRPRGLSLFCDFWDSSLVNNIHTCGLEYILLDSCLIPDHKSLFLPVIMSDLNKSIEILPYYNDLKPNADESPEAFVSQILSTLKAKTKKDNYFQMQVSRIVNISLSIEEAGDFIAAGWFDKFLDYYKKNETEVTLSIPSEYRKEIPVKIPSYICCGSGQNIYNFLQKYKIKKNFHNSYSIHDFLDLSPTSSALNNRLNFVSMLVNQYKHDKIRKKSARDILWQAQNGCGLVNIADKTFYSPKLMQVSYKKLMEAENVLRNDGNFRECISCFDYDNNGQNEYVCRMNNFFAYISLTGGAIQELELTKNTGNYCANLSCEYDFDGLEDNYKRGIFIDHLLTEDEMKKYKTGEFSGGGVFSRVLYSQEKFTHYRHEIDLVANAKVSQPVSLKKKYLVNSNGLSVQYIIKNEGTKNLDTYFAVESNFASVNFDPKNISYFDIDIINDENKITLTGDKASDKGSRKDSYTSVTTARVSDNENNVSFVFEPNEKCGFFYRPLIFKRPDSSGKLNPANYTGISTMYWHLDLEPGMETEKNINLTFISTKKGRK